MTEECGRDFAAWMEKYVWASSHYGWNIIQNELSYVAIEFHIVACVYSW